jgi:hypothetical protein
VHVKAVVEAVHLDRAVGYVELTLEEAVHGLVRSYFVATAVAVGLRHRAGVARVPGFGHVA